MVEQRNPVVVITGASSGIGRATAYAFARCGHDLVLAARRADKLTEVETDCRAAGVRALAVPTDVTREAEVEELARRADEAFGGIDVWFNNAGVGLYGKFEDLPSDAWRRVIETNLFGYVYGAKAALRRFRAQHRGILINNASIAGRVAHPDATAYVASKYAVRGLSEGLRQELLDEPAIHVCAVLPSAIDTPFFQHAANYSGRVLRAMPPVYPASDVAEAVVDLVHRPRREVVVGGFGKIAVAQKQLMPSTMTRISGRAMHAGFFADEPHPATAGALFSPMEDPMGVSGGWRDAEGSGGSNSRLPIMAAGLAAAAIPLAVMLWRRTARRGA